VLLEAVKGSRRHLVVISAALVIALGAPSRPRAAAGDVLPFNATERTLANGLTVIVVPPGFPTSSAS
jgi:zinc protease